MAQPPGSIFGSSLISNSENMCHSMNRGRYFSSWRMIPQKALKGLMGHLGPEFTYKSDVWVGTQAQCMIRRSSPYSHLSPQSGKEHCGCLRPTAHIGVKSYAQSQVEHLHRNFPRINTNKCTDGPLKTSPTTHPRFERLKPRLCSTHIRSVLHYIACDLEVCEKPY